MNLPAELNLDLIDQKYGNGNGSVCRSAVAASRPISHVSSPRQSSTRIAVKTGKKFVFIDAAEIIAIEAAANYIVVHKTSEKYRSRQSISDVAEKLQSVGFVRISRSVIVNSLFVTEIQSLLTGEYLLRVKGGAEYTVTRSYKNNLRLLSSMWFGPQIPSR